MKISSNNPFKNFKLTNKSQRDAMDWFSDSANNVIQNNVADSLDKNKTGTPTPKIKNAFGSGNNEIGIGNMYIAAYDAKHKATLPVWDQLPTFFIIKVLPNMFQVLNIHYMPLNMRVQMLAMLTEFTNNKTINDRTRLRMSWDLIQGMSQLQPLKECIKNHLMDHYTSPLIKIDPENWSKVAALPTERWVYQKDNK